MLRLFSGYLFKPHGQNVQKFSIPLLHKFYGIMIKNLLFDMGGVIFRQNSEEAFRRFREVGIDPDVYMGVYGQKEFFLDVETGRIDASEFCRRMSEVSRRVCSDAGRADFTFEEAQYCWLGFIVDTPVERLHHLVELRKKYHLCLLTNTNPFVMHFTDSKRFNAEGCPISAYFDTLCCSYEMGVCKPNADFFLKALEMDGLKPEESIFIDDSLKYVKAAERVGSIGLHVPSNEDWMPQLTALLENF